MIAIDHSVATDQLSGTSQHESIPVLRSDPKTALKGGPVVLRRESNLKREEKLRKEKPHERSP